MGRLRTLFGLMVLLGAGYALYLVVPVYWADYKLGQMLEDSAIEYTYKKSDDANMTKVLVAKAQNLGVELTPEQITVQRTASDISIVAQYSVHVDMPVYPFDINFKTGTKNHDVMK
jgi:hypothetical protein